MIRKDELYFARRAIRKGAITGEQVIECVEFLQERHSKGNNKLTLMDVILKKGYIEKSMVEEIRQELSQANSRQKSFKVEGSISKYKLLEKIGEGAMGVVYKAKNRSNKRLVALKILDQELSEDFGFISRFLGEAKNAAKLRHDNIVKAYDFGEDNGRYYFAMELIDGFSLAEILHSKGKITEKLALTITKQIARALEHASEFSIVHRDVKPENIMISKSGVAKLCDLGLAKDLTEDICKTSGGITLGTVYYASPEQAQGSKSVDTRSDIYSLGISLYYMLSGELPFDDADTWKVARRHITEALPPIHKKVQISSATNSILQKMTAKDIGKRYQTPKELIRDIDQVLQGKVKNSAQDNEKKRERKRITEKLVPRKKSFWQERKDTLLHYRWHLIAGFLLFSLIWALVHVGNR